MLKWYCSLLAWTTFTCLLSDVFFCVCKVEVAQHCFSMCRQGVEQNIPFFLCWWHWMWGIYFRSLYNTLLCRQLTTTSSSLDNPGCTHLFVGEGLNFLDTELHLTNHVEPALVIRVAQQNRSKYCLQEVWRKLKNDRNLAVIILRVTAVDGGNSQMYAATDKKVSEITVYVPTASHQQLPSNTKHFLSGKLIWT